MINSHTHRRSPQHLNQGFSLIEIAIGLLIMGLLMGGGLSIFSKQIELQKVKETQKILEDSKEALIGFALSNGRLPCPATDTSAGLESFCTNALPAACGAAVTTVQSHGRCTNPYNGFLPSQQLGIATTGGSGYATDGWGLPQNRVRYAITTSNGSAFTAPNGMKTTMIGSLNPDLKVCDSATGITATTCGAAPANSLTSNAVAVIYSLGKNAATGGTGTDEAANPNPNSANNDQVFISHGPSMTGTANGEFDDIMTWIAAPVLVNRMVQAGQLP